MDDDGSADQVKIVSIYQGLSTEKIEDTLFRVDNGNNVILSLHFWKKKQIIWLKPKYLSTCCELLKFYWVLC